MGLKKVHEFEVDKVSGQSTLVRTNPSRDYGWNTGGWDGANSDKKLGDTARVIAQRIHGQTEVCFYTAEGHPLKAADVPAWIHEDLKTRPLVGEGVEHQDTIVLCKYCSQPWPRSTYPGHLEAHIEGRVEQPEPADEPDEVAEPKTRRAHGAR